MKDMTNPDPNLRPEPLIDDVDRALRPQNLNDFTGQSEARANLKVFIESAKKKEVKLWIIHCSMVPLA